MRLLAIVLIVLTRLVLVLPLLLLWWLALLAKGLVLAIGDTGLFLVRLFIGGVLRPLGHRYALLAATAAVVVAGATMPELQNPSFYVVLAIALIACFLAGKFGKVLLPKAAPKTPDAADALAIAITHAHHRQSAILKLKVAAAR